MSSCVYIPHVEVSPGVYAPSNLWQELQATFKDRATTKEWYAVATNPDIIAELKNRNDYVTNEQGEVTLACLQRNIQSFMPNSDIVSETAEKYNGYYGYQQAVDIVQKVNREVFSGKGTGLGKMAILVRDELDKDTYTVEIVDRNDSNIAKLEKTIADRNVLERLIYYCKERGCDIKTIQDPENRYFSIYNSQDHNMEDDLYTLISMSEGTSPAVVARSVGHFAIASTINQPLTIRLIESLKRNPELVKYLSSQYLTFEADINNTGDLIQIAAALVADELSDSVDVRSKLDKIVDRIIPLLVRVGRYIKAFFKGTFTRGKGTIKSEWGLAKVKNQVDEIRKQSVEIAEGFMSHTEYTGSIEQALSASDIYETTEEGRSYRVSDLNTKVFNSVINSINNAIRLLKAIPGASVKSIQAIKNEGFKAFNADSSISEEVQVLQAIAAMVNELYGNSVAIDERLAAVEERAQYFDRKDIPKYAKQLREVRVALQSSREILSLIRQFVPLADTQQGGPTLKGDYTRIEVSDGIGGVEIIDLNILLSKVTTETARQIENLQNKEKFIYCKFLEQLIGGKFIKIAARKLFRKNFKVKDLFGENKKGFTKKVGEQTLSAEDIIKKFSTGTSLLERWLTSSSHQDLFMQLMDKCAKQTEKTINENIRKDRNEIIDLQDRWENIFGKNRRSDILYERHIDKDQYINKVTQIRISEEEYESLSDIDKADYTSLYGYYINEDTREILSKEEYNALSEKEQREFKSVLGRLSGNFVVIQKYPKSVDGIFNSGEYGVNVGDWEIAREYFEQKVKKDFMQLHAEELKTWTESQKRQAFDKYRFEKLKEWNAVHSEVFKVNKKYIVFPSRSLYSYTKDSANKKLVDELYTNDEKRQLFNDIFQQKQIMDSRLPKGSAVGHRIPQFNTTTVWDGMRNREYMGTSIWDKGARLYDHIITRARDEIAGTVEDIEYGSLDTYNTEQDITFEDSYILKRDKINRLPMYGINKLKNIDNLSTNIFHNLLSYSVMSNTYQGVSSTVDIYEMANPVLQQQAVNTKGTSFEASNTYDSFQEFKDKHIYRKNQYVTWKMCINKLAALLTKMTGLYYLGGNIGGAVVNYGTAVIELFKEAACGQDIELKNVKTALKYYTSHIVECMLDYAEEGAKSELGIFLEMVDYAGDFKYEMAKFNKHHKKIFNKISRVMDISDMLMLCYKSGDHMIQSLGYLSSFDHQIVYDKDGKSHTLLSLFKKYSKEGKGGQLLHDISTGVDTYFKSRKGIPDYNKALELHSTLLYMTEENRVTYMQSEEGQAYKEFLSSKGYNVDNIGIYGSQQLMSALEDVIKENKWGQEDTNNLIEKARTMTIRMHGIYNSYDQTRASQYLFSSLLLQMKGYVLGMVPRRFGRSKYSVTLGHDIEGSVITATKVLLDGDLSTMTKFKALFLPYRKDTFDVLQRAGFSKSQCYNLRRNFNDYAIITALAILKKLTLLAIHGFDDEDEEYEEYLAQYYEGTSSEEADRKFFSSQTLLQSLYYTISRLLSEQRAFNTPLGVAKEGSNITVKPLAVNTIQESVEFWDLYAGYLTGPALDSPENYDSKKEYLEEYKDVLYQKKTNYFDAGDPKYYKFIKKIPFYRTYYQWIDGEEAAKNYEYTRGM